MADSFFFSKQKRKEEEEEEKQTNKQTKTKSSFIALPLGGETRCISRTDLLIQLYTPTLRHKLQTKLAVYLDHSILTPGRLFTARIP